MVTARIRPLVAAAVAVGGVAVLATACSSTATSTAAASGTATHTPTASASPSTPNPATEALAAYAAMWAEVVAANKTSDYQAPDLADHLGGQALLTLTTNMAAEKEQGIIALGRPVLHPTVVSASATSVHIQDCVQDKAWLQYYAATEKLVDNVPGGDRATTATVTDENGVWKVTEMNSGSDGTCHVTP